MANDKHFATGGENRGAEGGGSEFVMRARDVFARELFQPMFERAGRSPDDVRTLISDIRHKLDALDIVVATMPGSSGESSPHPALQAALERPVDPDSLANGSGERGLERAGTEQETFDDIGRNQRSRLRELTLLDFMSRDTRAYSLQQILNALQAKGFDDKSGAVVSQLHRLKKLAVIHQPAGGMYEITPEGLSHLHKMRASFGSLLDGARG